MFKEIRHYWSACTFRLQSITLRLAQCLNLQAAYYFLNEYQTKLLSYRTLKFVILLLHIKVDLLESHKPTYIINPRLLYKYWYKLKCIIPILCTRYYSLTGCLTVYEGIEHVRYLTMDSRSIFVFLFFCILIMTFKGEEHEHSLICIM